MASIKSNKKNDEFNVCESNESIEVKDDDNDDDDAQYEDESMFFDAMSDYHHYHHSSSSMSSSDTLRFYNSHDHSVNNNNNNSKNHGIYQSQKKDVIDDDDDDDDDMGNKQSTYHPSITPSVSVTATSADNNNNNYTHNHTSSVLKSQNHLEIHPIYHEDITGDCIELTLTPTNHASQGTSTANTTRDTETTSTIITNHNISNHTLFPSMETLQLQYSSHKNVHKVSSSPSSTTPTLPTQVYHPHDMQQNQHAFPWTIPSLQEKSYHHDDDDNKKNLITSDNKMAPISTTTTNTTNESNMYLFLDSKYKTIIPKNTVPIKCIRPSSKFMSSSSSSEFHPLLLIHSIVQAHTGPIWKCTFNHDGSYFCTAGKDGFILLWNVVGEKGQGKNNHSPPPPPPPPSNSKVVSSKQQYTTTTTTTSSPSSSITNTTTTVAPTPTTYNTNIPPVGLNIPILSTTTSSSSFTQPICIFQGHTSDVVDISFSPTSSYLLSTSLDKTIKLWHPSRTHCLKTFYGSEIITCLHFYPKDDRYFVSAGFDKKISIWSIPLEVIVEWAQAPTFISAIKFTPDTKYIIAGLINGMVIIYSLFTTTTSSTTTTTPTVMNLSTIPTTNTSILPTSVIESSSLLLHTTTSYPRSQVLHNNNNNNNITSFSSNTTTFKDLNTLESFHDTSIQNKNKIHSTSTAAVDIQFVLRFYTQISCKKNRSKEGKKVTGFAFLQNLSEDKVLLDNNNTRSKINTTRRGSKEEDINNEDEEIVSIQDSTVSSNHHHPTTTTSNTTVQSTRKKHFTTTSIRDHLKLITHSATKMKQNKLKQKLLVTTNDSRLRLIGLDDFCTVRQYKGSMINNSLQIQARFSESGEYIICGSESGTVVLWNTATKGNPLKMVVSGLTNYDKVKAHEYFEASKADPPIVTDTIFVPSKSMKEALRASQMFPSMDFVSNVAYDMSSAAIITCDYEGTIRVFLRKSCLDAVYNAANDPIV